MPSTLVEAVRDGNWLLAACVIAAAALFVVCAVALAMADVREHRLPNQWTGALATGGVVILGLGCLASQTGWTRFWGMVGGGAVYFGLMLLLHLLSPTGMGMGDVKLGGCLGLYTGWLGWDHLFGAIVLGFIAGGLIALAMVLTLRATPSTHLPFGPAMLAGAGVALAV